MKQFIEEFTTQSIIPSLSDFVSIPNLSPQFDPEWKENKLLDKACDHLINWILAQNIPNLVIKKLDIAGAPSAIHVEIPSKHEQTILFYGHYDKQPHFTGWKEGFHPTKPVLQNDRLYGRGVADDGYAAYAAIATILTLIKSNLEYPHCIMLFEGEEESGSTHLMKYFDMLHLKKIDIMVALDSGSGDYERLWLTSSLRGSMKFDVTVKVLDQGVHSGDGSGIVPSAFNIFRELFDRLENSNDGRCHQKLHTIIPADRYTEALQTADLVKLDFPMQCEKASDNHQELYLNRTWRPTVSYIGCSGMPKAEIAGNVCLPEITFRISIRIPPNLDAKEASQFVKQLLEKDPPHNAYVNCKIASAGTGLNIKSYNEQLLKSLNKGSKQFFNNNEVRVFHEGASIPFLNQLAHQCPQAEFLVVGVLGPESNAHGANEMLDLNYMKGLIGCLAIAVNECIQYM